MNEKEIGEIRHRQRRDRSNMTAIYGCYVNNQKEIITEFSQSAGIMPENEAEKYFGLMRRVLSGVIGKNLIDVSFRTSQVADSPEHKLLMRLRDSALKDEEARHALYRKIIENVSFEDGFLILLGCESYDVPFKSKDGQEQADASNETYKYMLCAVCPVKLAKPVLRYVPESKVFHDAGADNVACAPELGFLFPAFDNRATNIYEALFYTHNPKTDCHNVVEALFNIQAPKPAYEQKKSFEALLSNALDQECSLEVVQSVHDHLRQSIDLHKESKIPEPLMISKEEFKGVLTGCGVSEDHVSKFSVNYDEAFGFEAPLHPRNLFDNRSFHITTPDVSIRVNPERSDLIETRIIDGVKYILICADEQVEVNGVPINIAEKEPATV